MTVTLAERLKTARLARGLTIRDVERLSKFTITDGYINQLENGRKTLPSPLILRTLCRVLKLDYIKIMMAAGYLTKKDLK